MRQAAESEIIRLSIDVREGRPIKPFQGKEVIVMPKKELTTGVLTWGDQVLCAMNKTRTKLNSQMRTFLGKGSEPESGDRIICLHNYDDVLSSKGEILVNGATGIIRNCYKNFVTIPKWIKPPKPKVDTLEGEFIFDDGSTYGNLMMDYNEFVNGERGIDSVTLYKLGHNLKTKHLIPRDFTYGYAITVWKSQGSEWNKIVLLEEGFPFDKKEHQQYLYTGITRAKEKVVLVLNH